MTHQERGFVRCGVVLLFGLAVWCGVLSHTVYSVVCVVMVVLQVSSHADKTRYQHTTHGCMTGDETGQCSTPQTG